MIRVKFPYNPELNEKLPVQPDGRITLPLVGEIEAAGLTTDELAEAIRTRMSDRLRNPEVDVSVTEVAAGGGIYVGGEVHNPGFVKHRKGLTPLQAIIDRGGFTDYARIDYVVYLEAEAHEYLAMRLDLSHPLQGELDVVRLSANDILYVPRNTIGDVATFVKLYIHNFLPIPPAVGIGFHPIP
jgi:polysaccharide export outer membrane protein